MANGDRAEVELHIGGQTRVLRFKSKGAAALEEALGIDPLVYLGRGMGQTKFVVDAILSGLTYDRAQRKELSEDKVQTWLDAAEDFSREQFQKDVLYAIARGRTGEDGKRMVRALDEAFGTPGAEAAEGKAP